MIPVRIKVGNFRRRFYVATAERALALQNLAQAIRDAEMAEELDVERMLEDAAKGTDDELAATLRQVVKVSPRAPERSDGKPTTFRELGDEWTSGRATERYPDHVKAKSTAELDANRLEYLCGLNVEGVRLGSIPLAEFTIDHAEAAMRQLPKSAKTPATRRQWAQLIHRVLSLAEYPYRVIKASPLPRKFLPRAGEPPSFPFIFPSEDAKLLACPAVPLARRVLWGFLAREGCRLNEALALRWRDFDFDNGTVSVERTKTSTAATWKLAPGVVAALQAWRKVRLAAGEGRGADLAFASGIEVRRNRHADTFRTDLLTAGVERGELHTSGKSRRLVRAHDLRSTFVTLALAAGRSEGWITSRTGHTSSAMLRRYERGRKLSVELNLGELTPLDRAIAELYEPPSPAKGDALATLQGESVASLTAEPEESSSKYRKSLIKPKWRNRQTRRTQNPFP